MIITIRDNNDKVLELISIHEKNIYLIYTDEYDREWKLEPLKNINIQMPFRIVPLPKETE